MSLQEFVWQYGTSKSADHYISIYLSIYLSIHPSIHPSIYLSIFSSFPYKKMIKNVRSLEVFFPFSPRQPNPSRPALRSGRHRPWLGAWSASLKRGDCWSWPSYITVSTLRTVIYIYNSIKLITVNILLYHYITLLRNILPLSKYIKNSY